jgi:hypothetical protein
MEDENVKKGIVLAEQVWWCLAKRIVFLAGNLYKWDETQWQDANEKFLKPSDYKVVMGD